MRRNSCFKRYLLVGATLGTSFLAAGCGGGGGGTGGGQTHELTKLRLVDSLVDIPGKVEASGLGPDGKIAILHDDFGDDTLETGGKTYPLPSGSSFDGVANLTARAHDGAGGVWLGHLDPATSTIVIDKHWDNCSTDGIQVDGCSDNMYYGNNNVIRLTLVSPTGDETDVPVPAPQLTVTGITDTYLVAQSGGNSAAPVVRHRGPKRFVPAGDQVPDACWLLSKSSQVKLQVPAGVTGAIEVDGVNNSGISVGFVRTESGDRAVQWNAQGLGTLLPTLPSLTGNWQATGISDDGVITGWYGEAGTDRVPKEGVIWQHDVPKLASAFVSNATHLQAFAGISNSWQVDARSSTGTIYEFQGS